MIKTREKNSRLPILIAVASGSSQQGKSTLILLLAGMLTSKTGMKVLVVELNEKGRISRLRQKEISTMSSGTAAIHYDIIQVSPVEFHLAILSYITFYDLIFIEIPSSADLSPFADIFLVSQVILFPIVALAENLLENQLLQQKLSALKLLKSSKKLDLELYGIFNKFSLDQDTHPYQQMEGAHCLSLFSSFLRFSLNYQIDLSSLDPVLPENGLEELVLVAEEFVSILQVDPYR